MESEELLKGTHLFSNLPLKSQEQIAKISIEKYYRPGEKLFSEGKEANSIIIIKSGKVHLTKGDERNEIANLGEGAVLGELTFLDKGLRSAHATAIEPTLVMWIDFTDLKKLLDNKLELAKNFYEAAAHYVAKRLRITTSELYDTE